MSEENERQLPGVKNGLVPNSFALILKHARRNAALNDGNKCHEYITRILRWNWNDGKVKSGKGGEGIFHAAHQWVVSCMYVFVVVATLCRANDAAANIAVGRNNKLPRPLLRVKGQLEEQLRTYLMTKIIWPFQKRVYLLGIYCLTLWNYLIMLQR